MNVVVYYEGPVTRVNLWEGSAFWYHADFKEQPEELWNRVGRDSQNDFWTPGLPEELKITGVTQLEPPWGYSTPDLDPDPIDQPASTGTASCPTGYIPVDMSLLGKTYSGCVSQNLADFIAGMFADPNPTP